MIERQFTNEVLPILWPVYEFPVWSYLGYVFAPEKITFGLKFLFPKLEFSVSGDSLQIVPSYFNGTISLAYLISNW